MTIYYIVQNRVFCPSKPSVARVLLNIGSGPTGTCGTVGLCQYPIIVRLRVRVSVLVPSLP